MTEKSPTWIDGIQVSGQELRQSLMAMLAAGLPMNARSGVRSTGPGDLTVTQNGTPNMSVNVTSGQCFIQGTETSNMGVLVGTNDATKNLTIAAADATNPRKDLIVARWYSETVAVGLRKFALEVVTGSPAASPVDPATPANALVLARVLVGAAVTSIINANITDLRQWTVPQGGILPCTAATQPTDAYRGMTIFERDTQLLKMWNDSAFIPIAGLAAWTPYTPSWSTSGTAPSLGNGSLSGRFMVMGKTLHIRINLTTGSSTTYGTGGWSFSLPSPYAASSGEQFVICKGFCAANNFAGFGLLSSSANAINAYLPSSSASSAQAPVSNTSPASWTGAGQNLTLQGAIEIG